MKRRKRVLIAALFLVVGGCAREGPQLRKVFVAAGQRSAIQKYLDRAAIVFVGELRQADFRWSCVSGLALCVRAIDLNVERVLKGGVNDKRLTIQVIMLGAGTWTERDARHGVRLSRRFFVNGEKYLILAEKGDARDALPGRGFVVAGDEQIWQALPENVRIVEGLVAGKR